MTKRISIIAAAATALLVPALLSACSGSGSADDGPTTPAAKDDTSAGLVQCMRDRGYDMPDQKPGGLQLSPPDGVDFDSWQADLGDCSAKNPSSGSGNGRAPKPSAKTREQFAEYAKCMRENGVADFPDDMDAQASYKPSGDEAYVDADQTCMKEAFGGTTNLPTS